MVEFIEKVNSETENMRIDRYLKKKCTSEPLSKLFQALRKGDVKVNNKKIKENYRLQLNDEIKIKYLKVDTENIKKYKLNNNNIKNEDYYKKMIVCENEDFFIVNKPRNISMHKGTGHEYGLSEIFKKIYDNKNINFANRLDNETSGLVIGCKNLKFLRYISEKIRNNKIEKRYMAIVQGKINEGKFTIKNYLKIGKDKVIVKEKINSEEEKKEFKESITNFKVDFFNNHYIIDVSEKIKENTTLLEIELITGRKHQIRAQLASRGFPILGDKKYGKSKDTSKMYLCCYKILFDEYEIKLKDEEIFK